MLALLLSTALAADAAARGPAPGWSVDPDGPLPTFVAGGRTWVVLAVDVPAEWVPPRRALQVRPTAEAPLAVLGAEARGLPAALAAWQGRPVTLGGDGGACTGAVTQLQVVSRMSWMDGFAGWASAPECAEPGSACDAVIRAEVASQSGERLLTGVVAGCGPMDGPAFVGAPPARAEDLAPDDPLHARAVAHLLLTEGWRRAQAAWLADGGWEGARTWTVEPAVSRFVIGERVYVSAAEETGGCGEPGGSAWAVWEVRPADADGDPAETWVELTPVEGAGAFFPRAAVDPDGDGLPTFYAAAGVASPVGGRIVPRASFEAPWSGCAC